MKKKSLNNRNKTKQSLNMTKDFDYGSKNSSFASGK